MKLTLFGLAAIGCVLPRLSDAVEVRNLVSLRAIAEAGEGACPIGASGCTQLGIEFEDETIAIIEATSIHRCKQLCVRSEEPCAGFSFNFDESKCHLKKSLELPVESDSFVSGTRDCLVEAIAACSTFNIGLYDTSLSQERTHNMQHCRQMCIEDPDCQFYTYNHVSRICYHKPSADQPYVYADDSSASTECTFDGKFPCTKLNATSDADDLEVSVVSKAADCYDNCRALEGCNFIVYEVDTRTCHLKAEHGKLEKQAGSMFSPIKCSLV